MAQITARFASTCPTCSQRIQPGQSVQWTKGSPARHSDCTQPTQTPQIPRSDSRRQITVERLGRRSYLRGDTLAVRSYLRGQGCHWDADTRAWWIGSDDEAQRIASAALGQPAEAAPKKRFTRCLECGGALDDYQQRRGYAFCSTDCANDRRLGGMSGYVNGQWHQGSDD